MGFLNAATDTRTEFLVVASARGKLTVTTPENGTQHWAKARVFVLEDRTATVVTRDENNPRALIWQVFAVERSTWNPPLKVLTVDFGENLGGLVLDGSGCGCGMGAVGNAGPVDGPYKLIKVRDPEWHTIV